MRAEMRVDRRAARGQRRLERRAGKAARRDKTYRLFVVPV
jgi:hypothetical protein